MERKKKAQDKDSTSISPSKSNSYKNTVESYEEDHKGPVEEFLWGQWKFWTTYVDYVLHPYDYYGKTEKILPFNYFRAFLQTMGRGLGVISCKIEQFIETSNRPQRKRKPQKYNKHREPTYSRRIGRGRESDFIKDAEERDKPRDPYEDTGYGPQYTFCRDDYSSSEDLYAVNKPYEQSYQQNSNHNPIDVHLLTYFGIGVLLTSLILAFYATSNATIITGRHNYYLG